MQAILNTPQINKCSAEALRRLIDNLRTNSEALRVLQIPIDSCDVFIHTIVIDKLNYNTTREFEDMLDTRVPTRAKIIEFLEKKA